jgi:ankyrin repeat protein
MSAANIFPIRHDAQPVLPNEYPLEEGDQPIHKAAYRGQAATLVSIIESRTTDVNILSTAEFTPLYMAINGNQAEAVYILLSAGANSALEEYMDSLEPSMNAVDHAAYCGSHHAMAALIDFGVEVPPGHLDWLQRIIMWLACVPCLREPTPNLPGGRLREMLCL